ncbi:hypothetical protein BDZ91DRAFT_796927 [Kalaharituber pfeilii]|nr:hypothetical protein BDZ91DRAFT_796927 [Kalaharituber pfeilii]
MAPNSTIVATWDLQCPDNISSPAPENCFVLPVNHPPGFVPLGPHEGIEAVFGPDNRKVVHPDDIKRGGKYYSIVKNLHPL